MEFQQGFLTVSEKRRKPYRKELGKVIKATTFTCRRMAPVLGQVRSVLPALQQMRAFTNLMVQLVNLKEVHG